MSVERLPEFGAGFGQLAGQAHHAGVGADQWLRQVQICQRLGISDETWRRWVKSGRAPAPLPNLPGRPRWRVGDIETFERGLFRQVRTFGGRRR